ncbi:MAG: polysaccharide biosynthesis C-terminal domain-containing protein [bacterium]
MRKELAALSKETLIYGGSTVVVRFLNFLLVPFYVNVLATTAEYGVAGSVYAWIAFLNVIYPLGLEGAFFRYASRGDHEEVDPANERTLFSSSFNILIIFGLIVSTTLFFLASTVAPVIFHDPRIDGVAQLPAYIHIIQYSAAILFFDSLAVLPFAALRLERKPKVFGMIKIINVITMLALNFILILGFHTGVEGIFLANMIASGLTVVILLPTFLKKWTLTIERTTVRLMLPFGLTNVPAYLGAMMVQVIDRPIVQAYLGLGAVGVYQANYRMGFIMMVFVSLFEYAWRPFFMRQHKTDAIKAALLFADVFTYFMILSLVGFLLLAFFLPYLLTTPIFGRQLLPTRYSGGINIIPVVLFAYIFQGMYTNFIAGIYIREKNKSLPLITGIGACVNVVSNIILIPMMGIMGAAIATLLAYFVMAVAIYRVAQNVYFVDYDWQTITKVFVIVGMSYGIDRILVAGDVIHDMPLLLVRILLSVAAIASLFIFGIITKEQRNSLRSLVSR